jgi:acyl-CoA thioesterase I
MRHVATRVACMGDSITRGNASHEPGENGTHRPHKPKIANRGNFPLELQRLMGGSWEVRNFGHGGRSVVGASAYDKTAEFERACRFAPAIVLLMLGTNDAKVCPAPPNPSLALTLTTPSATSTANPNQIDQHSHP